MTLELKPLGFIQSTYSQKYEAPKQAHLEDAKTAKVILKSNQNFETALHDLDGFSHIWLIYQFDRNSNWKPKVLPPRKDRKKRGVFSTRSPYRPNPIGMSVVKLEKIVGRTLYISDHDILDNTAVLDIKPYIVYADSHPDASQGWLSEDDSSDYIVDISTKAKEKLDWLSSQGVFFENELLRRLTYDPLPHPYRRITKMDTFYQMRFKEWCADYTINDLEVKIIHVYSGFSKEKISNLAKPNLHERFAQQFD